MFAVGILTGVAACGLTGPDSVTRTLEVAPYRPTCFGVGPQLCLEVREPGGSAWTYMYEKPQGFEFKWGVATTIVVEETEVEQPLQDGSSIRRRLIDVLDERTVPGSTQWSTTAPALAITSAGADEFTYFGSSTRLRCHPEGACDALDTASDAQWLELTVLLPERPEDPLLVLSAVACGTEPFCRE